VKALCFKTGLTILKDWVRFKPSGPSGSWHLQYLQFIQQRQSVSNNFSFSSYLCWMLVHSRETSVTVFDLAVHFTQREVLADHHSNPDHTVQCTNHGLRNFNLTGILHCSTHGDGVFQIGGLCSLILL